MDLDAQYEVDQLIGQCVLSELYEDENAAQLQISIVDGEIGVMVTTDARSAVMPSDDLLHAAGQLADLHEREGTALSGLMYEFTKKPDGDWAMSTKFEYDEQGSRPAPPQSARGWRRWFGRN